MNRRTMIGCVHWSVNNNFGYHGKGGARHFRWACATHILNLDFQQCGRVCVTLLVGPSTPY